MREALAVVCLLAAASACNGHTRPYQAGDRLWILPAEVGGYPLPILDIEGRPYTRCYIWTSPTGKRYGFEVVDTYRQAWRVVDDEGDEMGKLEEKLCLVSLREDKSLKWLKGLQVRTQPLPRLE